MTSNAAEIAEIRRRSRAEEGAGPRSLVPRRLVLAVVLVLLLVVLFFLFIQSERDLQDLSDTRHEALMLAAELRQASDDLTRMARTYALTRNPAYKQHFHAILAIRDGALPRPQRYWLPYWDFAIPGIAVPPRETGPAAALMDLLRDSGLTEHEALLLKTAKDKSDALAAVEQEAMRLLDAEGADAGAMRARAVEILFNDRYLQAKADIMRPIAALGASVDERTLAAVEDAKKRSELLRGLLIVVGVLLAWVFWLTQRAVHEVLGGTLAQIRDRIRRIEAGEAETAGSVRKGLENSVLGWLVATHAAMTQGAKERAALEADRERFFSLSIDLLCIAGTDGYFKRLSPAFTETLGYPREELLGKPFLDFIHPDDRAATQAVVETLGQGQDLLAFENRYRCKDGGWKWIRWNCRPFPKEGLLYATGRDVTGQREASAALKKLSDDLARSNADLEQFAYIASHDLQEPLRAVAGSVELLEMTASSALDDKGRQFVRHAVEGVKRMQLLISDLLRFSRVNRKGPLPEPVASAELLDRALANLSVTIEEADAVIIRGELPTIVADAGQIVQVFQNLVANGIKFCTGRRPQIRVGAQRQGAEWVFSVQDNGIGIDPRYFDRIFEIFQRLHTRTEYVGTGIGLSLCKKIIDRHGGRIWVESEPGKGSTFHFSLPTENQANVT